MQKIQMSTLLVGTLIFSACSPQTFSTQPSSTTATAAGTTGDSGSGGAAPAVNPSPDSSPSPSSPANGAPSPSVSNPTPVIAPSPDPAPTPPPAQAPNPAPAPSPSPSPTNGGPGSSDPSPSPGPSPIPIVPPVNPTEGAGSTGSVPVYNVCSAQAKQWTGTTLKQAPGIQLKIYELTVNSQRKFSLSEVQIPAGTYDPVQMKNSIVQNDKIPIPTSLLHAGANYSLIICSSDVSDQACQMTVNPSDPGDSSQYPDQLSVSDFIFTQPVLGPFNYETPGEQLQVFQVDNSGNFHYEGQDKYGALAVYYDDPSQSPNECQGMASPLIIDTQSDVVKASIQLSSPEHGIHFDILGNGSRPVISWPVNPEKDMFLVLPDGNGKVLSVQQMFGNNTKGPDGQKANNGFAALAKYARPGQQSITPQDAIFHQLRLWSDLNKDGQVQDGELLTLDTKSITSIQLNPNDVLIQLPNGNQLRERSQVMRSGSPFAIFDLWFALPGFQK